MKFIKPIFAVIFLCLVLFISAFPQIFRCWLAPYDDFVQIQPDVYVSGTSTIKQQDSLKKYIKIAKGRIAGFWGSPKGHATILFCDDLGLYSKFCRSAKGAGCSIGTPLGSWIVLNKDGLNPDVIAHEMSHDELMTSLGWWKTRTTIPTWFDEGLALMFDHRFVSTQDSARRYKEYVTELTYLAPRPLLLNNLKTEKDFFGENELYTRLAYLTAASAVSRKIAYGGKEAIMQTINTVKRENEFEF